MRHDNEERGARILIFGIVIFACASLLAPGRVAAQRSADRPSGLDRARERQIRRNDQMDTSIMLDALRRDSRKPVKEESLQPAYFQLQQDFVQMQTVNNQMMQMTFANNVLDYKRIAEASSEIRKRASRLKSNLPLLEAGKEEAREEQLPKGWNELDQGQVKPALLALDDLIMSFVSNPVFQKPQVVDLQQSSKARRELEAIIKLSAKIKKSADKLTKTATARPS